MEKLSFAELKSRVSWGSVFGGVMTVLAISVLLSILNSSIGLFMFDPLSDYPVSGIGTVVGIGSAVILVAGMVAGGFVAGKLAGADGIIHVFLVWATTLIVAVVLRGLLAAGAAKMTANALGQSRLLRAASCPVRVMLLKTEFPHCLRTRRSYSGKSISTQP